MRTSTLDNWKSKNIFHHFSSQQENDCSHQLREEWHALGACSYNELTEWLQNDDNFRNLNRAVMQCQKRINIHLKLFYSIFHPLQWIIPCCFDQSRWVIFGGCGLEGKGSYATKPRSPGNLQPSFSLLWSLVSRGTLGWNAQGKCSSCTIWSWSTTSNKVLPYRLLERCSTRPWCPSFPRFSISNKKINDKEPRFPETCSRLPRWLLWSIEFD